MEDMLAFYRNKKILVTGQTGFKGAWLCMILKQAGANVVGYALEPPTKPNLFELLQIDKKILSIEGDIRDLNCLTKCFEENQPEIVIHMAAQPIVSMSYEQPVHTYETNVMGTVNILECIRNTDSVKSVVNVTTDKVYHNNEWYWGYRENDRLGGFDPYSNSKACSEMVTDSYKQSYLDRKNIAVSTARAGNVIGGGDFAKDRIIPDCIRAAEKGERILVRNPFSIRPYQHVLEALFAYLLIAQKQYKDKKYEGNYNIGPDINGCITTHELVDLFCRKWGEGIGWARQESENVHEANTLELDCSKMKAVFNWHPVWGIEKAVDMTVEMAKAYQNGKKIEELVHKQVVEYCGDYSTTGRIMAKDVCG